jgi:hypothetical protein
MYDDRSEDIQLASVKREFEDNGLPEQLSGDGPEIKMKTLKQVNYASHADTLQEEN